MRAGAYLEQLQEDLSAQGLGLASRTDLLDHSSRAGLANLLSLTRRVGSEDHRVHASEHPEMQTALDKIILEYGTREDVAPFSPKGSYMCYDGDENNLVDYISNRRVSNPYTIAPVTIVEDGEPLAVISGGIEFCSYGLKTNIERGIIAGFFSQAPRHLLERMRKAETGFFIDAEEAGVSSLLRVSSFLVPYHIRAQLAQSYDKGSLTTHEALMERAKELLKVSVALPPANEASIENCARSLGYIYEVPYFI